MQEKGSLSGVRTRGLVVYEYLTLFFVIFIILIAVVNVFTLNRDDESIPPYRAANALYIHQALEQMQVSIMAYREQFGVLPGDDPRPVEIEGRMVAGNGDGRIDPEAGEAVKVFADMAFSGGVRDKLVRVRGRMLELLYVRFLSEGRVLREGNFFRLDGLERLEALAYDRKFDDGNPQDGDVLYFGDDDTVTFYCKLSLGG